VSSSCEFCTSFHVIAQKMAMSLAIGTIVVAIMKGVIVCTLTQRLEDASRIPKLPRAVSTKAAATTPSQIAERKLATCFWFWYTARARRTSRSVVRDRPNANVQCVARNKVAQSTLMPAKKIVKY
jgi:hypothetical protein